MVGETATFRANIEVCERMARNSPTQYEKYAWLGIAEAWRLLITTCPSRGKDSAYDKGLSVAVPGQTKIELELGDLIRHLCSNLPR